MAIRVMDMFCGISAFRSAAEKIGGFEFVGYCECDPTAIAAYRTLYNTEGEYFCNDARAIILRKCRDADRYRRRLRRQDGNVLHRHERRRQNDRRGALHHHSSRFGNRKAQGRKIRRVRGINVLPRFSGLMP